MTSATAAPVFLSYAPENHDVVEALARRLQGDARLRFWFGPWHSIPGVPIQEQMEQALRDAQACAVCISSVGEIKGWQNEQMRTAIQTRVEDDPTYRIVPVLLPGAARPHRRDLPPFLRRYEPVEFHRVDDEQAFRRLLAGILGMPPIQIDGYIQAETGKAQLPPPPSGRFDRGHALLIGVANYPRVRPLGEAVLHDVQDLHALLIDPATCGYREAQVIQLLDAEATGAGIRAALVDLAAHVGAGDTAVVFFSGHGAHNPRGGDSRQYLLPYDCDPQNLSSTARPKYPYGTIGYAC
ncbi:MAG: TIR domain-containing protein [Chloroflexota bacterium]|nr:TIR domain-containing protein [Chloroflexota bacterium]